MMETEKKETYIYFVDDKKYETHERHLTGSQIKAKLPPPNNSYQLFEDDEDKDKEDKLIRDDETVDLKPQEEHHPEHKKHDEHEHHPEHDKHHEHEKHHEHHEERRHRDRHFYTVPPATFGTK